MIDDRLRGAGPAAVEVAVVGSEDQPVVTENFDDVCELVFIGLEGKIKLAAFQQLARCRFQIGRLHAKHFVMLIHAVKPVGQPAAAGF